MLGVRILRGSYSFFHPVSRQAFGVHKNIFFQQSAFYASHKKTTEKARWYVTRQEVAKHDKEDDCWIIINGKVYDITEWQLDHPGGDKILQKIGRDSTELFLAVEHSNDAYEMMKKYYIADLVPEEAQHRFTLGPITKEGLDD